MQAGPWTQRSCPSRVLASLVVLSMLVVTSCSALDTSAEPVVRSGGVSALSTTTTTTATTTATTIAPSATTSIETTTTTSTTAVETTTTVSPRFANELTMAFTGDVVMLTPLIKRAEVNGDGKGLDFRPMFDRIRSVISAVDYAVCHLELPIKPEDEGPTPTYWSPPEIVPAVADAGFDRCSTASNHSLDRGTSGIDRTLQAIADAGITQNGIARTEDEARVQVIEANGFKIAHLSYTYATPKLAPPSDEPWRVNYIKRTKMRDDIKAARAAGAEYVILSLHFGSTMITAPSDFQKKTVRWLWDNTDVDLIVGCHAHVIQPATNRGDRYAFYGLGNHLASYPAGKITAINAQDGALALVTVRRGPTGKLITDRPQILPTWVGKGDGSYTIYDARDFANPDVPEDIRKQLERSYYRTRRVLDDYVLEVGAATAVDDAPSGS